MTGLMMCLCVVMTQSTPDEGGWWVADTSVALHEAGVGGHYSYRPETKQLYVVMDGTSNPYDVEVEKIKSALKATPSAFLGIRVYITPPDIARKKLVDDLYFLRRRMGHQTLDNNIILQHDINIDDWQEWRRLIDIVYQIKQLETNNNLRPRTENPCHPLSCRDIVGKCSVLIDYR